MRLALCESAHGLTRKLLLACFDMIHTKELTPLDICMPLHHVTVAIIVVSKECQG
jgi:hypothetical protein